MRKKWTMEQWPETLQFFDHKCAYCGGEYQVKVIRFIESKGLKISFHIHEYKALRRDHVILYCEGCGQSLDVPGLSIHEAKTYIDQYFRNTGYAFIA